MFQLLGRENSWLAAVAVCLPIWICFLTSSADGFQLVVPLQASRQSSSSSSASNHHAHWPLQAAPKGALSDIVIPNVASGIFGLDATAALDTETDPRVWVP